MFTVPSEEVCVYNATFLSFIDSRVLPAILHLVMLEILFIKQTVCNVSYFLWLK